MIRELMMVAPSGRYPDVRPLAQLTMSGDISKTASEAMYSPRRPNPVTTSSATIRMSFALQISEMRLKYPGGGTRTPPMPMTGSAKKQPIRSAPTRSTTFRELLHQSVAVRFRTGTRGLPVRVGSGQVVHAAPRYVEAGLDGVDAAQRCRCRRRAVIGVPAGNDAFLVGLAEGVEVSLNDSQGGVVRGGAPGWSRAHGRGHRGRVPRVWRSARPPAESSSPETGSRKAGGAPARRLRPRSRFARTRH